MLKSNTTLKSAFNSANNSSRLLTDVGGVALIQFYHVFQPIQ